MSLHEYEPDASLTQTCVQVFLELFACAAVGNDDAVVAECVLLLSRALEAVSFCNADEAVVTVSEKSATAKALRRRGMQTPEKQTDCQGSTRYATATAMVVVVLLPQPKGYRRNVGENEVKRCTLIGGEELARSEGGVL